MHEKTIRKETLFNGKILALEIQDVELENGQKAYREIIRHAPAISVLVRTPDDRFVFIRQFRKAVEQIMTEVVAGINEPGEEPLVAARRELKEETGYDALSMEHLGSIYPTPGYVDERIDLYFAEVGAVAGKRDLDEDERLEIVTMSRQEVADRMKAGQFTDAKTICAWALYQARHG